MDILWGILYQIHQWSPVCSSTYAKQPFWSCASDEQHHIKLYLQRICCITNRALKKLNDVHRGFCFTWRWQLSYSPIGWLQKARYEIPPLLDGLKPVWVRGHNFPTIPCRLHVWFQRWYCNVLTVCHFAHFGCWIIQMKKRARSPGNKDLNSGMTVHPNYRSQYVDRVVSIHFHMTSDIGISGNVHNMFPQTKWIKMNIYDLVELVQHCIICKKKKRKTCTACPTVFVCVRVIHVCT